MGNRQGCHGQGKVREQSGNSAKSHRKSYFLSKSVKSQGILCEKILQKLTKEADTLATEAKTKNKMDLLVKSNAMYSKSGEKRKGIENEEKNIDSLQKKLKANVKVDMAYLIIRLM